MQKTKRVHAIGVGTAVLIAGLVALAPARLQAAEASDYAALADEVEAVLRQQVLAVWFPASVDERNGGFISNFSRDWKPLPDSGGKFSVFQGRMTWVAAQIVLRRPDLRDQYLPYVRHGLAYLRDVMWDAEDGGFYWGLGDDGKASPRYGLDKHLYGMSFCIYGAAAAYAATHDPAALELAQRGFRWMEAHAHDAEYGGYRETLRRDGTPVEPSPAGPALSGVIPFPAGYKSMNTHIHLLESLTQLYAVWPDPVVRARLEELLGIVRDRVAVAPGAMHLYFNRDWKPVPDHDSYGHDVETGYLLLEASEALGHHDDAQVEHMARLLVDHPLAHGWDADLGGFYQEGTTFGPPEDRHKEWWVQMEGLNALLLMHQKYGAETGKYLDAFRRQWQFVTQHEIDHEQGGVYRMIDPDGRPDGTDKSGIWKGAYHDSRALMNVSDRLRALAAR